MKYPLQMSFWLERIRQVYPDLYNMMPHKARVLLSSGTLIYNKENHVPDAQIVWEEETKTEYRGKWTMTFSPECDMLGVSFRDANNEQRSFVMELSKLFPEKVP